MSQQGLKASTRMLFSVGVGEKFVIIGKIIGVQL